MFTYVLKYFRIVVFFLFVFSTIQAYSQGLVLQGVVTDEEGNPLQAASVSIPELKSGVWTDALGRFRLDQVPHGSWRIRISYTGYQNVEKKWSSQMSGLDSMRIQLMPMRLDEVVISGNLQESRRSDSPIPIEVYAAPFLRSNPTPTLFEALQNINGVRPQLNCNICNTGDIHLNGMEGPYTMVLIDGMPIVSGLSTVYGLQGIPSALIQRVEIVKGPSSTLFGSEAVGGLINIITRKPGQNRKIHADAFGTSWAEWNLDIGLQFNYSKKIESLTGINIFNYQNPLDFNRDGFTDVALQERYSVFHKIQFLRRQSREASLSARLIFEDRWGGQMNWTPAFRGGDSVYGEQIDTRRWEVMGKYQLPVRENIMVWYSLNGHYQNSAYGTNLYLATQHIGFGQVTWNKKIRRHDLLSGLSYRFTHYDDSTPATVFYQPDRYTHLPGVFVQDQYWIHDRLTLLSGLRYDYHFRHGNIFSPRLNLKRLSLNQKSELRFGVGSGYRVASIFTEDHAALTGARKVVLEEQLKPETSWNFNLNWLRKFAVGKGHYLATDATFFYTWFGNRILPDYNAHPDEIRYRNLEGYGISQGGALTIDWITPSGWSLMIGSTYADVFVVEANEKNRPVLTERISGVWRLSYLLSNWKMRIEYTGNIYGPMLLPLSGPLDDRPSLSPVWSIQNIQATKTLKNGMELYGGIKNLLNFRPPANSISRALDPFDKQVVYDALGNVLPTAENPRAQTFDPTYMFAPNQGLRFFLGLRY